MIGSLHRRWDFNPATFSCISRWARAARRLAPAIAVVSAGCSIAPIQQEVTGIRTEHLVTYIRCETRLAIQDKAIELLEEEPIQNTAGIAQLKAGRGEPWPRNARAQLTPHEQQIFDKYIETGIALDFSFDITEGNGAGGMADPIRLITNGTAGVGLSASGDYKRQNTRHFIVSDTARDLLFNPRLRCPNDYRGTNFAYPISGSIGIKELISTFFDLNETKQLGVLDKDKPTSVFVDTLIFTTTLMGAVAPHVIVSPVGNTWGLASPASVSAGASRIDKHQLIVGLSLDTPKGKMLMGAAVVPGMGSRSALQKINVRSYTEQSALDAVGQARLDAYLDRAVR